MTASAAPFDTLRLVERLESSGMSTKDARAVAAMVADDPAVLREALQMLIEDLLGKLQANAEKMDDDPLAAAASALDCVIRFLGDADRLFGQDADSDAVTPLWRLSSALRDLSRGAKPPLLFDRRRAAVRGAPTKTAENLTLRPIVLVAYEMLTRTAIGTKGVFPPDAAARELESMLSRERITHRDGKPITARQIVRWSQELGGKSPTGSDAAYLAWRDWFAVPLGDYLDRMAAAPGGVEIRRAQRALAQYCVRKLRRFGF